MIKSGVTPLLPYILIFKLEVLGKTREPVCQANNFYCLILRIYFCCLYLKTVLSERAILTEKGKRHNKSYITTNHKENSFLEFIIAQILDLYFTLLTTDVQPLAIDRITPQEIKTNGPN